jgi:Tol biopolymer transport system component
MLNRHPRIRWLCLFAALACPRFVTFADDVAPRPTGVIGYTEYRADLPGGMHPYFTSLRAHVVNADGSGRKPVGASLVNEPHAWTQFAGWSPDGKIALINRGWESPENAAWEEEHQTFRMTQGWLNDVYLLDMTTEQLVNVTGVDRVSIYNTGVFYWPNDPNRLGFQALIGANSHPFSMDRDGRNKKDLTEGADEFAYGFNASPDGKRIAYHMSYRVYLADADGGNAKRVETGHPFNFVPQWSPDGQWLLFVSGEHYDCHPHVVRRDGTGLVKVGDRQGYRGVIECIDKPAFHSAGSDVPIWSVDGKSVYYTAKFGNNVELMRTDLAGRTERLTHSPDGTLNYHPKISPDGRWLCFGSNRTGTRQLYVMLIAGRRTYPITTVQPGRAAMHAYWRPR